MWSRDPSCKGPIESNELNVTEGMKANLSWTIYLPIQRSDIEAGVTRVTFTVAMLVVTQYYRESSYGVLSNMHRLKLPFVRLFSV